MLPSGANMVRNSFHKVDFLWNLQVFNEKQSHLCFLEPEPKSKYREFSFFFPERFGVCRIVVFRVVFQVGVPPRCSASEMFLDG